MQLMIVYLSSKNEWASLCSQQSIIITATSPGPHNSAARACLKAQIRSNNYKPNHTTRKFQVINYNYLNYCCFSYNAKNKPYAASCSANKIVCLPNKIKYQIRHYSLQITLTSMPYEAFLLEVITCLTTNAHSSPRNLILKNRYRHPDQLPTFVEFLSFILVSKKFNTQQPIQIFKVTQLVRELIIEADLYISLLLLTKISPLMRSKSPSASKRVALQNKYKEWLDNTAQKMQANFRNSTNQVNNQMNKLFEWIENRNYFEFYFQSINRYSQKDYQNVQIFLLEIENQKNSPFNKMEQNFLKRQMLAQNQKLANNKYKHETIKSLYQWIKAELKQAFAQPYDKYSSLLSLDTLSRIVRADCDLSCSAMVQALQHMLTYLKSAHLEHYLHIVDEMLLSCGVETLIQLILVLAPAIFMKVIDPKAEMRSQLVTLHFEFWKYAVSKRFGESNLLICLSDWTKRILNLNQDHQEKIKEMLQMFKLFLQRRLDIRNQQALKKIFHDKQMEKIDIIYEQIPMFREILQKSEVSQYFSKQKKKQPKDTKNYETSELSSKGEIMSMLESLNNKQIEVKLPNSDQNTQQLNIYSNKNFQARVTQKRDQDDSTIQKVNQALSWLNLLEFKGPRKEPSRLQAKNQKKDLIPFLPLFSSNQKIISQPINQNEISDPYGLKVKCRQKTLELSLIFIPISQTNKKKIVKNRGIIIKTNSIEIGFIIQSLHSRRKLLLFTTFSQPLSQVNIKMINNSVEFAKAFNLVYQSPKIKTQFKSELDIEKVKLYMAQAKQKLKIFIKPKISIKMIGNSQNSCIEINQEIPIHLYNLIQWLEIPLNQETIFLQQAQIASNWQKVCRSVRKINQDQIKNIFPYFKVDKKGNILLKMRFLLQTIFCKIYIVLDKSKVELINSDSEILLLALLEIISQQANNNQ